MKPQQRQPQKPNKLGPSLEFEKLNGYPRSLLVGVDEVGRGCLAGPVVAAACILPADLSSFKSLSQVTDSKLLSAKVRERLDLEIRDIAVSFAVGLANPAEIDELNIHFATHLAMVRAVEGLKAPFSHILVDGKFIPKTWAGGQATAIIKGDLKSLSIACASIIAKVWRDHHMEELEAQYPGYGFSKHKGYPTQQHTDALAKIGVSAVHRKSFAPVRDLQSGSDHEYNTEGFTS